MNWLHIIGNLTADPSARVVDTAAGPRTVCDLSVAVNRYVRGEKTTEYFRVSLWEKMAENAMKYLVRGSKVSVTGPVSARAYTARDGSARASLEIREVREIEYLSARQERQEAPAGPDGFVEVEDDELPF